MTIHAGGVFTAYILVVAALAGASFGSFINCAAYRIARGESFISGRSRCPACGHELGFFDLIPIMSWLLLKGKCRYCGAKVSVRYFLTECLFAFLTVLTLLRYDLTLEALANWIFLCCLLCLSLVDLETKTIPDGCLLIPLAAFLVYAVLAHMELGSFGLRAASALVAGAAILLLSLGMDRILGRESMGGGDIKLYALVGLYLGPIATIFAVILSCLIGLLAFAARKAAGNEDAEIPFGPAIAAAAAFMLLLGDGIVNWYAGLLGL